MKRRSPIPLYLLAGVSSLLCAAAIAMWVTCYGHPQMVMYDWLEPTSAHVELRSISWMSGDGYTSFTLERTIADSQDQAAAWGNEEHGFQDIEVAFDYSGLPPHWDFRRGFILRSLQRRDNLNGLSYVTSEVGVPYWFLAFLFALFPILWANAWIRRRRTARRIRAGCCTRCGYDLRATPDRCPECGAARPKAMEPR